MRQFIEELFKDGRTDVIDILHYNMEGLCMLKIKRSIDQQVNNKGYKKQESIKEFALKVIDVLYRDTFLEKINTNVGRTFIQSK